MAKGSLLPAGVRLTRDSNLIAVPSSNGILTNDNTGSPQTSPLSYTTGVVTIVVPDNAVEMVVSPTTDIRVSELVGVGQYDIIKAGSKESIPCLNIAKLYFQRDASNGTLYFRFNVL